MSPKNTQPVAAICFTLILSSSMLFAATIRLPSEEPTIQAGIDASVDGDTVLVADGMYTGYGNKNLEYGGKAITVVSENGPEYTVIDCENSGRGFYFSNYEGQNSRLGGFTIRNGRVDGDGGGIYCYAASPTMTDCTITNCSTQGLYVKEGGGISCKSWSSPTIVNCAISQNYANWAGGGISCRSESSPTIVNCPITGNVGAAGGGGISCNSESSPTITNCTISGNRAESLGGGIDCLNRSSPTILNCIITGNVADFYGHALGGGIHCSSSTTILNCTITGNVVGSPFRGGGIYGSPTVKNCILWDDSPDEIYGSPTIIYSDIQGGWPGEGNIDDDPIFTLKSWFGFDYGLRTDSPCIDAGDPAIEDEIYDWHPFCPDWYVNGVRSDMGAYGGPGNIDWLR